MYQMEKTNTYTSWFRSLIIKNSLQSYFEMYLLKISHHMTSIFGTDFIEYYVEDNIQRVRVEFYEPIYPSEVKFEGRFINKIKNLEKWANSTTLNRLYSSKKKGINETRNWLPKISREIRAGDVPEKFQITDGNHRFYYASQNNIPSILCLVEEVHLVNKEWVEKIYDFLLSMKLKE